MSFNSLLMGFNFESSITGAPVGFKPDKILAVEVVEEGRVLSKEVIKTLLTSFQERLDAEVMFDGQPCSVKPSCRQLDM